MKEFFRSLFKKSDPIGGYQPKVCKSEAKKGESALPKFGTSVMESSSGDSFEHEKHKDVWGKIRKTSHRLLDLIDLQEFSEEMKKEKYYADVHAPGGLVKVCWYPNDNNFIYSYMPTEPRKLSPTEEVIKSNYVEALIIANGLSEIESEVRECIREYEDLESLNCGKKPRPAIQLGK